MQVIVSGRKTGKSEALIKWLYDGKQQLGYPGWSRIIVCTQQRQVRDIIRMIKVAQPRYNFHSCNRMLPHPKTSCEAVQQVMLSDIRKAVWSLAEYKFNSMGGREFEFAVDNVDEILADTFHRQPALITMTGELRG